MDIHYRLVKIQRSIVKTFSVQITAVIASIFISSIFYPFFIYYEFRINKRYDACGLWLSWIIMFSFESFYVALLCHRTSKSLKNTGKIIHRILDLSSNISVRSEEIWKKLLIFSRQVKLARVKFSAMGFFEINASILFLGLSGSYTHLILMVQYEEGIQLLCFNKTII
ncbi:unnamed protein product [Psylliodes chrysocephalus]|uniref:Uncharacterized protein n=1 Tax=Psylliodes chrysocephalus TaxID=3402493 RepID=A0A9P0D9I5_9CUCU|nr:unnamed protein product [Psylliodes chrysocephala]